MHDKYIVEIYRFRAIFMFLTIVPERITFRLAVLAGASTTWRRVASPPGSSGRATLVTGSVYARRRRLCSMFLAPIGHVTIGGRAFSSTAARVWNSLPTAVQSSESLDIFRRRLKTELFERSYN